MLGPQWEEQLLPADSYEIGTAKDGDRLEVIGMVKQLLPLQLGNHPKILRTRPLVIKDLSMKMNICGPFLHQQKIDQLHSEKALRLESTLIPLRMVVSQSKNPHQEVRIPEPKITSPLDLEENHRGRGVYIVRTMEVAPCTSATVAVKIHPWSPQKDHQGVIQGRAYTRGYPGKVTLVQPSGEGETWMPMLNLDQQGLLLQKGERVGTYTSGIPEGKGNLGSVIGSISVNLPELNPGDADLPLKGVTALKDLLRQYQDIFKSTRIPVTHIKHQIKVEEIPPIRCKGKPVNPVLQDNLTTQLLHWKSDGVIEESVSPWSFGLLPIAHQDGTLKWAADFRRLNEITIPPPMRIPNLQEGLQRLKKGRWFSHLVGKCNPQNLLIEPQDRVKTAFQTPEGSYQLINTNPGLRGVTATQANLLEHALSGLPPGMSLLYLGDSFLISETWEQQLSLLEEAFQAYRQNGVTLDERNSQFLKTQVKYGGYQLGPKGVQIDPDSISIIEQWPTPGSLEEWRNFDKLVSYYKLIIPNYVQATAFLKPLVKGGSEHSPMVTQPDDQEAFGRLKDYLTSTPVLTQANFQSSEPLILDTDWSNSPGGIGGVISQKQDGVERVICYGARQLTKAEKNFSSNRGELAAVIYFANLWAPLLLARPFILRIDHQALRYVNTMIEPKGLTTRWLELLGRFIFTVQFRAGTKHGNADALSRATHLPPTTGEQERGAGECLASIRLARPPVISESIIRDLQEEDPDLKKIRDWVKTEVKPTRGEIRQESIELRQYVSLFEFLYLNEQGVLYRRAHVGEFFTQDRLCLPPALHKETVKTCHEMAGGHLGINITQTRMMARFYFPGLHKYVEGYIGRCIPCQRKRGPNQDQRHTLAATTDGYPFRRLSIDFVGPMKPSSKGSIFLFTIKCTFTKWIEAIPCIDTTAAHVAKMLEENIFCRFGIPEQIHSDQGPQFTSKLLTDVCRILNVPKTVTPAYNPKSNPVERAHRDLTAIIKAITLDTEQDWEETLPMALLAMRTARNRSTGVTPHFALFGREAVLPIDLIYENQGEKKQHRTIYGQQLEIRMQRIFRYVRRNLGLAVERARGQYGGKLQNQPLQEEELVWLFTPRVKKPKVSVKKYSSFWAGPFKIITQLSDVMFLIRTEGEWNRRQLELVASIDRLKRYYADPYHPTESMDLTSEDLTIADEFLEQGVDNLETLPQFRRQIITHETEADDPYGGDPGVSDSTDPPPPPIPRGRVTAAQLQQLNSQAQVHLERIDSPEKTAQEDAEGQEEDHFVTLDNPDTSMSQSEEMYATLEQGEEMSDLPSETFPSPTGMSVQEETSGRSGQGGQDSESRSESPEITYPPTPSAPDYEPYLILLPIEEVEDHSQMSPETGSLPRTQGGTALAAPPLQKALEYHPVSDDPTATPNRTPYSPKPTPPRVLHRLTPSQVITLPLPRITPLHPEDNQPKALEHQPDLGARPKEVQTSPAKGRQRRPVTIRRLDSPPPSEEIRLPTGNLARLKALVKRVSTRVMLSPTTLVDRSPLSRRLTISPPIVERRRENDYVEPRVYLPIPSREEPEVAMEVLEAPAPREEAVSFQPSETLRWKNIGYQVQHQLKRRGVELTPEAWEKIQKVALEIQREERQAEPQGSTQTFLGSPDLPITPANKVQGTDLAEVVVDALQGSKGGSTTEESPKVATTLPRPEAELDVAGVRSTSPIQGPSTATPANVGTPGNQPQSAPPPEAVIASDRPNTSRPEGKLLRTPKTADPAQVATAAEAVASSSSPGTSWPEGRSPVTPKTAAPAPAATAAEAVASTSRPDTSQPEGSPTATPTPAGSAQNRRQQGKKRSLATTSPSAPTVPAGRRKKGEPLRRSARLRPSSTPSSPAPVVPSLAKEEPRARLGIWKGIGRCKERATKGERTPTTEAPPLLPRVLISGSANLRSPKAQGTRGKTDLKVPTAKSEAKLGDLNPSVRIAGDSNLRDKTVKQETRICPSLQTTEMNSPVNRTTERSTGESLKHQLSPGGSGEEAETGKSSYLKVSKSKQQDDVTRRNPHRLARAQTRVRDVVVKSPPRSKVTKRRRKRAVSASPTSGMGKSEDADGTKKKRAPDRQ